MKTIRSVTAYYPSFHIGDEPRAIECQLSIVEANDKRYLKTPFAMLNAYADDDIERSLLPGRGYYATADECKAYLAYEYPNWQHASPIMEALCDSRRLHGNLVGTSRIADRLDVSSLTNALFMLARGHKSVTLRSVKRAVKTLAQKVSA